ncbi:hypothetical protein RhiirA4_331571, partial [Rhizophagus irregularis]
LAHSFVLDPDDDTYLKENVFTESELSEIRHFQAKETPLMPLDLIKYLNSFNLKTTSEIRKQIFSPDQMDQDFNRSRDFDRDWIRNTIYNLLQEYESNTLKTDHLELWILVHVCRVLRSKSFSIATNIKEFGKTLPLISLTWKAKVSTCCYFQFCPPYLTNLFS